MDDKEKGEQGRIVPDEVRPDGETRCQKAAKDFSWVGERMRSEAQRRMPVHPWLVEIAETAHGMAETIRCEHKRHPFGSGARGNHGWVYVVHAAETGLAKIGSSSKVQLEQRLRHLQGQCPVRLRLIALAEGRTQMEAQWHFEFKTQRRHGEWFSDSLIAPLFSDAWERRPAGGCARCVIVGDQR